MIRIIILGGSFGGLTAALELRQRLGPDQCDILLLAKDDHFVFIPSLPWVAIGARTLEQISFPLAKTLKRKTIRFSQQAARQIDPEKRLVHTDQEDHHYDYLIIATGHRSANEAVPGLGPFDGPGHSLMSPPEVLEARQSLKEFLLNPGPLVVGCAPGASCIGPSYEFAFAMDHLLRQRKIRHRVPITLVTPEPFPGHFGLGGVGNTRRFVEDALEKREISYHTSAVVSRITSTAVELADGPKIESCFSLILPPLAGVKAVTDSPGLANAKGFIPVDEYYRHPAFPNIYAAGVAVAMAPVAPTPVPVNFPKTGGMTEQMARAVAHNIAADIQGGTRISKDLFAECIMDMGDTAAYFKAEPVRPPRNVACMAGGKRWLWAKKAFERYYLWKARRGKTFAAGWGW